MGNHCLKKKKKKKINVNSVVDDLCTVRAARLKLGRKDVLAPGEIKRSHQTCH